MRLDLETCGVRSFRETDAADLAQHANNRKVWLQLRDRFPHPYSVDDARGFIAFARGATPESEFAITVDDLPLGAIGAILRDDVERYSAEVGYWLGEPYWGCGIATRVLAAFTRFAFEAWELERLYAIPLASNTASCRVIKKVGYQLEGRMRRRAVQGRHRAGPVAVRHPARGWSRELRSTAGALGTSCLGDGSCSGGNAAQPSSWSW